MTMVRREYSLMTRGFSGLTSAAIYVGDARTLSLSLVTQTTASTYTVQGSNANGFTATIPENTWSTITLLTAQGIYGVQPGVAWLRAIEAASTSSATMLVVKQLGE